MRILKYILSILLVIWGLVIALAKIYSDGFHFPFLTVITLIALISGIIKHKKANLIFFISACLWMILSAETIGYVIFFDEGNYDRMLIGIIPFAVSMGVLFSNKNDNELINTNMRKFLLVSLLMLLGIGSYIYKPTMEEINCWYYLDSSEKYNVLFAEGPERTFEVELSSDELKEEVKANAQQFKGRNGYYCPETKVHVVTSFGKIISVKIMSFRNSEIDKNVKFNSPTKIPPEKVNGKLEILKPHSLRLWN